jgi:Cu/Ag efflux pump CusA
MNNDNRARLRVAALVYTMVNAVVFGTGLIAVLLTPVLAQRAFFWIAFVVAVSFILSAPLSWLIAPLMMQRFVRARQFH